MTRDRKKQGLPYFASWFSSKQALVTGATSGIGKEIARQLVDYGCKVLLCGRNRNAMDSLLEELSAVSPSSVKGFIADFSHDGELQELIAEVDKFHDIDILVNNAGFGYMNNFCLMPQDEVYSMEAVNIKAVVSLCYAFLPGMVKKSRGGILNVGSVASFFATPASALYGATKHFILGFTDALHQEVMSSGVHVTGVYPDKTQTRFLERATNGKTKEWEKAMNPDEVARLALKGLSENKIRVIPGFRSKIKVFIASLMPISMLLKKSYSNTIKCRKREAETCQISF